MFRLIRNISRYTHAQRMAALFATVGVLLFIIGMTMLAMQQSDLLDRVVIHVTLVTSAILAILALLSHTSIEAWADRHVRGEKIAFYDDLLVAWDKAATAEFEWPSPARKKLERDLKEASGNGILVRARLNDLRWVITRDEDLADCHRTYLQEQISRIDQKVDERDGRAHLRPVKASAEKR